MTRPFALVTGASMGIGAEIARELARREYDLALVARSVDKLEALANELRTTFKGRVEVIGADLGDPSTPEKIFQRTQELGIHVEMLVNNAGFGTHGKFVDLDLGRELEMIRLNVLSLTEMTHRFLQPMRARGRGQILNIASTAAFQPGPNMAVYYATKSFVLNFSEGIAEELRGTGITVTTHCPGPTRSEFTKTAGSDELFFYHAAAADAKSVAIDAVRAALGGQTVKVFGLANMLTALIVPFGPRFLVRRIVAWLNSFERKAR